MPDHSIERLVPTGHIFILTELDGIERNTFDSQTLEINGSYREVWISGAHRNHISISAHEKEEMFVIQFKPYGAYPFFHFPVAELNEQILPAQEVIDKSLLDIRKQLIQASSSKEKFEIAQNWLLSRFQDSKQPPEELVIFINNLHAKSDYPLTELIDDYPTSQKNLIDQFKKYVGLTPKYYHRILRFNEMLKKTQNNEAICWTDIAYVCGYSDQSHFIKEFKHFLGLNPREFLKMEFNKSDELNFFPMDREG